MSRRAKITFAVAIGSAAATVPWVHYMQDQQRETLRLGPVKDAERRQQKKSAQTGSALTAEQKDRTLEYEEQKRLREMYSKEQPVSIVLDPSLPASEEPVKQPVAPASEPTSEPSK